MTSPTWSVSALTHSTLDKTAAISQMIFLDAFSRMKRHEMETFSALLALCEGIHRSPVDSPDKGSDAELLCFLWSAPEQTDEQTMEAGDYDAHYDVTVIFWILNQISLKFVPKGVIDIDLALV